MCQHCNVIVKSRGNNYKNSDGSFYTGLELSFGNQDDFLMTNYIQNEGNKDLMKYYIESLRSHTMSLNGIISVLFAIKGIFEDGNREKNDIEKNIASCLLNEVSTIFFKNYEKPAKYNHENLTVEGLKQYMEIMNIRKLINSIVLVYRFQDVQADICGFGTIQCLEIASPTGISRYYLSKNDIQNYLPNIEIKISKKINQYLNTFNLEIVTYQYIEKVLKDLNINIEQLSNEAKTLNEIIDISQRNINSLLVNNIQKSLLCFISAYMGCKIPVSFNLADFINLYN